MKVLEDKYPMGSLRGQHSPGRYVDGYLYENLCVLADKIVNDMTFLAICYSSTLEVGTGKSVLCTQIGEIWTDIINKKHNLNLEFTMNNVVFRPRDLIDRAFQVPRFSFVLVDEWEDAHYWSELGITLRQFFRKCRQLNLFIMMIIPNFFQMPIPYAVSRSVFAIDVRFGDNFSRGNFAFYGFEKKKDLRIKGYKTYNYKVANPDFEGAFTDGYGVPEQEYREKKYKDMLEWDRHEAKSGSRPSAEGIRKALFFQLYKILPSMSHKVWAECFNVNPVTISRWLKEGNGGIPVRFNKGAGVYTQTQTQNNRNPISKMDQNIEGLADKEDPSQSL